MVNAEDVYSPSTDSSVDRALEDLRARVAELEAAIALLGGAAR